MRLPELRYLILDAGGINQIDATGVQTLRRVVRDLRDTGVDVYLTRVKHRVYQLLRRASKSARTTSTTGTSTLSNTCGIRWSPTTGRRVR